MTKIGVMGRPTQKTARIVSGEVDSAAGKRELTTSPPVAADDRSTSGRRIRRAGPDSSRGSGMTVRATRQLAGLTSPNP